MEHQTAQEAWSSYLADTSSSQEAQLLSEAGLPNGSRQDHAGTSREGPGGRKRRGRKPTQTPGEKKRKKNEADRIYRKNLKDELNQLRAIASRVERVEKLEQKFNEMKAELHRLREIAQKFHELQPTVTEVHRLEQMKSKFGGIEEMESKLDKFEQITSKFGGIDEMVIEIDRLKNRESQYMKYEEMQSCWNHQNAQPVFGFLQQQGCHGIQYVNYNNQVQGSEIDWLEDYEISEIPAAAMNGTMPDAVNSDPPVPRFNAKLDENVMSDLCSARFNDLLGECQTVGAYTDRKCTFPHSLVSNIEDIFNDHVDVAQYDHSNVEKGIGGLMPEENFLGGELEDTVNEINANKRRVNIVHDESGLWNF